MKKIVCSCFVLLFVNCLLFGQAQEGTVDYQKSQHPAAFIELPYSPDIVNAALNDYLSKKGKSGTNALKGFTTFRNTRVLQQDSANADLYFKVERKSKKEKQASVVSLLLAMPKEGVVAQNNVRYLNMEEAKAYLNELVPAIEAYNLELLIKDQNDAVIKAESKYKTLTDDATGLEKKKEDIEKKIRNNKQEQQTQKNEVDAQKQKLAEWVSLRKS
jgi:hypothetical protein